MIKKLTLIALLVFAGNAFAIEGLTLSWQDNSGNEKGFIVEASEDDGEFAEIGRVETDITEFVHAIPDEKKAVLFTYRVKAWNDYGESGFTNTVAARRIDYEAPDAPSNPVIKVPSVIINAESVTINTKE